MISKPDLYGRVTITEPEVSKIAALFPDVQAVREKMQETYGIELKQMSVPRGIAAVYEAAIQTN